MIVCHIGRLPIEAMGLLTQDIFYNCVGDHIYCKVREKEDVTKIPLANIYIFHCFKKGSKLYSKIKLKGIVISLIHSSCPCKPNEHSNKIINISKTYYNKYNRIKKYKKINDLILGTILPMHYEKTKTPFNKNLGVIARNDKGKFHKHWNKVVLELIEAHGIQVHVITNDSKGLLQHKNITYYTDIKITDTEKKKKIFEKFGIFLDLHGNFKDTLCIALVEAMLCGKLPLCLDNGDARKEINLGYTAKNLKDFIYKAHFIIKNSPVKIIPTIQELAHEKYSNRNWVEGWNKLLTDMMKK